MCKTTIAIIPPFKMRRVTRILAFLVISTIAAGNPTKRDTTAETTALQFESSHVGLIISPILSATEIRQLEIYWTHSCLQDGDTISVYTEEPTADTTPIYTFEPTTTSGIEKTGITADFVATESLTFARQCLGYYVSWLRNSTIVQTNCLETRPNWMAERKNELGSQKIRDLFIPGTHDTGSFAIIETPQTENRVSQYVITQDEDTLAQMIYGIRYLDIRVGYYPTLEQVWWVNHGIVRIHVMQDIIDDVKTFLDNTEEIIIFDVQEFPIGFDNMTIHEQFVAFLEEQFKGYTLSKSYGWSTTLDTIWNSGKRLIIGYDQNSVVSLHDSIWPCVTHQWGDVREVSALYDYLSRIETNALSSTEVNPRSAMAELTPNTLDVLLNRLGGLRKMAEDVNMNVTNWYQTEWNSSANIVAVDFFKGTGIIEVAIELNDRRFSDSQTNLYTCSAN